MAGFGEEAGVEGRERGHEQDEGAGDGGDKQGEGGATELPAVVRGDSSYRAFFPLARLAYPRLGIGRSGFASAP